MTKHRPPKVPDDERPYEVGYRHPPKKHAFTKGQRANPSGRPRKPRSNGSIVRDLLSQKLKLRIDGKIITITGRDALFRAQLAKAVKGDRYAADFLLRRHDDDSETLDMVGLDAADKAIISSYLKHLAADPQTTIVQAKKRGEKP